MAIGRQLGNLVAGVAVSGLSSLMGGCPRVDLGTGSLPALDELTGTRPSIVYEDDLQLPLDERKPDADGFIPGVYGFSVNPKEGQKATEDITPLRSADGREPPVNFEVSYSKDTGNNITGGQIILKDNEVPFVDGTRFYADLSATTYVFAGYGEQTKLEFTYVHNRPGADNSLSSTVGELEDQVGEITTTVGNLTGQVSQNIGDIQDLGTALYTHTTQTVPPAHTGGEPEDPTDGGVVEPPVYRVGDVLGGVSMQIYEGDTMLPDVDTQNPIPLSQGSVRYLTARLELSQQSVQTLGKSIDDLVVSAPTITDVMPAGEFNGIYVTNIGPTTNPEPGKWYTNFQFVHSGVSSPQVEDFITAAYTVSDPSGSYHLEDAAYFVESE